MYSCILPLLHGFFNCFSLPSQPLCKIGSFLPYLYSRHYPQGSIRVPSVRERQQGVILIRLLIMPKVKTNSSAKKRFRVTGSGEITFQKAFKRHILTKKSTKRKRSLRMKGTVHPSNLHFVKRLLGLK